MTTVRGAIRGTDFGPPWHPARALWHTGSVNPESGPLAPTLPPGFAAAVHAVRCAYFLGCVRDQWRKPEGRRVADLGTGPWFGSAGLAEAGYEVTPGDPGPGADETFDVAVCSGLFGDDLPRQLARAAALLKTGGVLGYDGGGILARALAAQATGCPARGPVLNVPSLAARLADLGLTNAETLGLGVAESHALNALAAWAAPARVKPRLVHDTGFAYLGFALRRE